MQNRSTLFFILFLVVVAVLLGLNYYYQPFANSNAVSDVGDVSSPAPTSVPATNAELDALSSRQKVAQLLAVPLALSNTQPLNASSSAWISDNQPGAITLFGTRLTAASVPAQIAAVNQLYSSAPTVIGHPLIVVDHEGGSTQRLSGTGFTQLPSWQSLCDQPATTSAELLQTSAKELKAAGVDMVLAPVADVALNHPVLKTRICSDDPAEIVAMDQTYIQAMAQAGIFPVVKHFPGIGQTTLDLHQNFDRVVVTTNDALIYQTLLTKYPNLGVMMSHVGVTNQHPDLPCSLSIDCVGQVSANYPNSLVVSDALEMKSAAFQGEGQPDRSLPEIAEAAVRAGNQLLIFGPQVTPAQLTAILDHLDQVYQQDQVFQRQVDRAILRLKQIQKL